MPQTELAELAIQAMTLGGAAHHEVTLANRKSDGTIRHTMYEFWPARVSINALPGLDRIKIFLRLECLLSQLHAL